MVNLQELTTDEINNLKKKGLTFSEITSINISIDQLNRGKSKTHEEVFGNLYAKIGKKIGNNFNIKTRV